MKLFYILALSSNLLLAYTTVWAQDTVIFQRKWYNKLGISYSFASGASQFRQDVQRANNTTSYTITPFSYGKGIALSYGIGYAFSNNFGLEMNLSYSWGGNNLTHNIYRNDTVVPYYYVNQVGTFKANVFRVNPCVVLSAKPDVFTPYMRMGFLLGWGKAYNEFKETATFTATKGIGRIDYAWELDGLMTVGFNSALGLKFQAGESPNSNMFIEFIYQNSWGTFKNAHMSSMVVNGTNKLSSLSTSQKELVFVDAYTTDANPDPNQPTKVLTDKHVFDSVGFNAGFIFKIR